MMQPAVANNSSQNATDPDTLLVTVVIPAYKRPEKLRLAVASAIVQDLDPSLYEVIVVDSSPTLENVELVEELAQDSAVPVTCLHKKPEGPGPSRFLGARQARGRYIAYMDSDCVASPGWLRAGADSFRGNIGLVQGRVLADPEAALSVFSHYIVIEEETPLYETANVFYRRDLLLATGGFSADLHPEASRPMGGEDVRMGWKVKNMGYDSCFCHDALVYHEIIPLPVWKWIIHKQMYMFPKLVLEIPELRDSFYYRYFFDRAQAGMCAGLLGTLLATISPLALLLWLPYVVVRVSEHSATLKGPIKLLRALFYFPRDISTFLILLVSSIRHRCLLL